jgi:hypothetical protein
MKFWLPARIVTLILIGAVSFCALGGCALKKKASEDQLSQVVKSKPLKPEESKEMLKEVGQNWLYGQGVGETALTVGTIVIFPPYALWVLGNAALSVSGYESIKFSDALPPEEKAAWVDTYDSMASGPGRLTAAIAGKEFRTQDVAKEKLDKYIHRGSPGSQRVQSSGPEREGP